MLLSGFNASVRCCAKLEQCIKDREGVEGGGSLAGAAGRYY